MQILGTEDGVPPDSDPKHWDPDSAYGTNEEEICDRTPHTIVGRISYTYHYKSDNESIWKLIVKCYKDHPS